MAKKTKKKIKKKTKKKTTKKTKKKGKRVATSTVVDKVEEVPVKAEEPRQGLCFYCEKVKVITDGECDDGFGGPDVDVFRDVCADCAPAMNSRYACAALIFDAMESQLRERGKFDSYQIKDALQLAWRSFHAELDTKAMVGMAKKMKVKHPWLKGKKAK